jgi:hypothetical protein
MVSPLSSKPASSNTLSKQDRRRGLFALRRDELWRNIWPVLFVLGFEAVKAAHHSVFVGPHLKLIDPEATAFWTLDMLAAGLVTFVMVRIFLKFEDLHDELDEMSGAAHNLAEHLTATGTIVASNTERLSGVADQVASHSEMLHTMYETLRPVFHESPDVAVRFYDSMRDLTTGWAKILLEEDKNTYADDLLPEAHVAVRCWGSAIQCYLGEEATDIKKRTVASNLPVYLELINTVVQDIRKIANERDLRVELFASANLLPSQYYNWGPEERHSKFMDDYRDRLRRWRTEGVNIRRVIVVDATEDKTDESLEALRAEIAPLGLASERALQIDATKSIVCKNDVDNTPKLMPIDEIRRLTLEELPTVSKVDTRQAYAISASFRDVDFRARHEVKLRLFEVFEKEMHSGTGASKCFILNDPGDIDLLQLLPTITGFAGDQQRSVDFMAIRVSDGNAIKSIGCVAARAKPNEETMLLHFITTSLELQAIDQYISRVESGTQSKPLADLIPR